jgi:hypothetical protein
MTVWVISVLVKLSDVVQRLDQLTTSKEGVTVADA